MDANAIMTAISTVGFPIVACGAMYWYMLKANQERREDNAKFTEAINNNTIALTKLAEKMECK